MKSALKIGSCAFMQPEHLDLPEAWVEHIPFAFWLAETLQPKTFVELGTHSGNSYLAFCQAFARLTLNTKAVAVDTWEGDDHAGRYDESVFEKLSAYHNKKYAKFSTLMRSTFDDALPRFEDGSIELLHIDGLHTYEAVKHDFESWQPKLAPNAVVIFHDTNVDHEEFAVHLLWAELSSKYPSFEFKHCNGLGVLGVGDTFPAPLRELFASSRDPQSTEKVRQTFQRLGRAVRADLELRAYERRTEDAHNRLAELTTHYSLAMRELTDVRAALEHVSLEKAELVRVGADIGGIQANLDELKEHYDAAVAQLQSTTIELQAIAVERDLLLRERTDAKTLQEHLAELTAHYHVAVAQLQGARDELKTISDERDALARERVELAPVQANLAELTAHYHVASEQLQGAHREMNELASHYNAVTEQLRGVREEFGELAREHRASMEDLTQKTNELDAATSALTALKANVAELTLHYDATAEQLREARVDFDRLTAELNNATSEAAAAQKDLIELTQKTSLERDALTQRHDKLSVQLTDTQNDLRASRTREADAARTLASTHEQLSSLNVLTTSPRWLARTLLKVVLKRLEAMLRGANPRVSAQPSDALSAPASAGRLLFDEAWYRSTYAEALKDSDPWRHFADIGWREGRNPNAEFVTAWYVQTYADVGEAGINPLTHFVEYGAVEGRRPGPSFDPAWYVEQYPDVPRNYLDAFSHFMRFGRDEGRSGVPTAAPGHDRFLNSSSTHVLGPIEGDQFSQFVAPRAGASPVMSDSLKVDVIVPVYGGYEETRTCIESVIKFRDANQRFGRFVLVDDCGPEPDLRIYLRKIASEFPDFISLIVNEENRGFVYSVNQGMQSTRRDVVLLNSDTEVNGDWLDRLTAQAYSANDIGTVTPFSNNATICSYPEFAGSRDIVSGLSLSEIDGICAEANAGQGVEMPTGVGFCMLIKRACLDQIGALDYSAFGKGYGEETDFCQRAIRAGWKNWFAGDIFVYHAGEVSFGATAAGAKQRAGEVMRSKHPEFEADVQRWVAADPGYRMRAAISFAILRSSSKPLVLHITHAWGGGTEKHIADLVDRDNDAIHAVLLVRRRGELEFELFFPVAEKWERVDFSAARLVSVTPMLKMLGAARIQLHHMLEVYDEAWAFLQQMDVPYDFVVHDYASICPRLNVGINGRYCGEPDEIGCLECLGSGPEPRSRDIVWWRQQSHQVLEDAERVVCPTKDVAERVKRYVPTAKYEVVPHEEGRLYRPKRSEVFVPPLGPNGRIRVAALGVFAEHKGGKFLLDCIRASETRSLPIDWIVLGDFDGDLAVEARSFSSLTVAGRYKLADIQRLIGARNPHLLFFPQHIPETYSFTLSEAIVANRPTLTPDLGAFPERVASSVGCWTYSKLTHADEVVDRIAGELRTALAELADG